MLRRNHQEEFSEVQAVLVRLRSWCPTQLKEGGASVTT